MELTCRTEHLPYQQNIAIFFVGQCYWEIIIQKNNFIIKLAVKATMLYTFSKAGMLPMKLAIYKKGKHAWESYMVDKTGLC